MVIRMTRTVAVIIQAVSPLSGTGGAASWAKPSAGASSGSRAGA